MKFQLTTFLLGIEDYMLPCLTKQLWGFDCPGCGLQRSLAFLLKGDFSGAFEMYPAIFALIPLFALVILDNFFKINISNKIIVLLSIISVAMVLGSYILKFL
ncbi:DUF2752 domain-containing protein [Euzebyella saccharophila]|uniref:DUF2752 domain-containing protein n=1 Tax=Euzebyella saccharophila TaxID=679664 RepID=A0ABV8JYL0_9FLAO|nr:DUF2752 domain-containing protein [Euzebyella saccharophila]